MLFDVARANLFLVQLKATLGGKTSIDKFFGALLQHQASVFRTVCDELSLSLERSRTNAGVPGFLHLVASRSAKYVLDKMIKQWNYFDSLRERWIVYEMPVKTLRTSTRRQNSTGDIVVRHQSTKQRVFSVQSPKISVTVNVTTWECDCSFFTSNRIPCQHIFAAASVGLHFAQLPARVLRWRWDVQQAVSAVPIMEEESARLLKIRYSTPGVAPESDAFERVGSLLPKSAAKTAKIVYVPVKGRKKGQMHVLGGGDKLAIFNAEISSARRLVRRSPSVRFYARMTELREMFARWATEDDTHMDVSPESEMTRDEIVSETDDASSDGESPQRTTVRP